MFRAIGLLRLGVEILLGFSVRAQRCSTHCNDCSFFFSLIAHMMSSFLMTSIIRIHLPTIIFQQIQKCPPG